MATPDVAAALPARPASARDAGAAGAGPWVVLALGALALLWSWWRTEGYPLADVVEDLEWTDALLRGERVVDSEPTRPFGYLVLLAPLVLLGRLGAALGLGGGLELAMQLARLFQVAATLLWVALTARYARRATAAAGSGPGAARLAGLAAGALLALNPLVLRWGIEPTSEIVTGVFLLLAVEAILLDDGRPAKRRGLLAGLALGAASLTAYKSIAIVAPVFAFGLLLARRLRLSRAGLVLGLGLPLLVQSLVDLAYHGAFGESLRVYGLQNIGNIVPVAVHRLGEALGSEAIIGVARDLYEACREVHKLDYPRGVELHRRVDDVTSLQPRSWYLTHLHEALTWPGVALVALGLVRAVGRALRARRSAPDEVQVRALLVPALAVAFYVALMSYKGSKDYRLWLPILSFVAAVGGLGAAWVAGRGATGRALALLAVAAAGVLGVRAHAGVNQRQFAGYWRAIEFVESRVAGGESPARPVRVGAAFHWAVLARTGPELELVKLPRHLDGWERHDEAQRAESLAALARLDWFVAHLALVTSRRELLEALGRDFEVVAAFYRPETEASPGPVLVLRRTGATGATGETGETGATGGRGGTLLRTEPGAEALSSAGPGAAVPLGFEDPRAGAEGAGGLRLLGYRLLRLAGDGLGWIELRWHGARTPGELRFLTRATAGDATVWSGDHAPAHGLLPTSAWPPREEGGLGLVEGYAVLEPWGAEGSPALWVGVATPEDGGGERLLRAVRPADGRPVLELSPPGAPPSPEGWRTVEAGLVQVGPATFE